MGKDLKSQTITAIIWSGVERFSHSALQLVINIVLARLLLPADFGLIAYLAIFIAISHSFINSGFGQALIQKQDATNLDESSIFYFSSCIGFIAALIMFFSAPYIADFYNEQQLVLITKILAISLVINSFGHVQWNLMQKNLDFKLQFKVNIYSTIISGSVSILMAVQGFGFWSLVTRLILSDLMITLLLWIYYKWRPSLNFSFSSLKTMYVFGSRLFIVSITNALFTNIYETIIGKYFISTQLGYYSKAKGYSMYPVSILNGIISQVTFPVFSKLQNDKLQLKNYASKSLIMITFVTFPFMFGLIIIAEPLIEVVLTDKWLPIVPYFQLLCVIGILYPLQTVNLNVLNAQGRSDLFLLINIIGKILIATAVFLTYDKGITYMIYGQIITAIISYFLNTYYTKKLVNYSVVQQVIDMLPAFVISLIMGFVIYYLPELFTFHKSFLLIIVQSFIGLLLYIFLAYLFKIKPYTYSIKILKSILKK